MQSKHLGLCLNSSSFVLTSSLVKKHLRVWNLIQISNCRRKTLKLNKKSLYYLPKNYLIARIQNNFKICENYISLSFYSF